MDLGDECFPYKSQGDVKLKLGRSRVYQVESDRLRDATEIGQEEKDTDGLPAGAFCELLAPGLAVELSRSAIKRGVTTKYLMVATETGQGGKNRLKLDLVPLDCEGRPLNSVKPALGYENGLVVPLIYNAFTAILGAIYGRPIDLGESGLLSSRIEFALTIEGVAEDLGVKFAIANQIENGLTSPDSLQDFCRVVAADPAEWLEFSYRIRSRKIFREAMIHAVGQFHTTEMQQQILNMRVKIFRVLQIKANELKEQVKTFIMNVQSYYPAEIQRKVTTGYADTDNIGRASYANDIFHWIGLSALRQYISQEAIMSVDSKDFGYTLVENISKGGNAYLTKEDLEGFHQIFPMTGKAKDVMEKKIGEMKKHVKPWTGALLTNRAALNTELYPTGYFTCSVVEEKDYPFENFSGGL